MKEYLDLAADFISKVGFPIFIAIVLLWRDDTRHAENVRSMQEIINAVRSNGHHRPPKRRTRRARP